MAATLGGAIKAYIETLGLGVPVFRDKAPRNKSDQSLQSLPYIVVIDGLGNVPRRTGDNKYSRTNELVQIDLYEYIVNPATGERGESYSLAKDLFRGLLIARFTTSPEKVWQPREFGSVRRVDEELNEIQTTTTLQVVRDI